MWEIKAGKEHEWEQLQQQANKQQTLHMGICQAASSPFCTFLSSRTTELLFS